MMLGEARAFLAERNTAPGGKLPLNANGGGLSYMPSGMYGMYALQDSVRQVRGIAPHRGNVPDDAPCVRRTGLSALRVEMRFVKRTLARGGTAPRLSLRGNVRQATVYKARNRDTCWFSILDSEWPPLKAAFERWLHPANFDAAGRQRQSLSSLSRSQRASDRISDHSRG
jgi:hypothetical protein